MKKFICLLICVTICLLTFVGCSQTTVPNTTAMWSNGETLNYTVRKASDAELVYSESSTLFQRFPDDVTGTYVTHIEKNGDLYVLETTYDATETYRFNSDDALLKKAKTAADGCTFISLDGNTVTVNVFVKSVCSFNDKDFLPQSSSKVIKSAVFINETTVKNGKIYDCECSVNDVDVSVSYDYSSSKPKATVKTVGKDDRVVTLAKTSTKKTYDNEQLAFLIRSFKWNDLVSNGSTSIAVFDGAGNASDVALTVKASSGGEFYFHLGGVWETAYSTYEFTYYMDGENYLDLKGNTVNGSDRLVAEIGVATGGAPILYYFDHESSSSTSTNKMVRMQQSYVVFDIDVASL